MKFIKDPAIINVIKFSVFILMTMVGVLLLPTYIATIRDGKYIKAISERQDEDFDQYLVELSAYYEFYYDKDPVIDHMIIDENDVYFEFSVYSVSYYQKNNIGDALQFFIHDAKYQGKDFEVFYANILYTDLLEGGVTNPNVDINYLNLNPISKKSSIKSFFVADLYQTNDSDELNYFKAIELYIKTDKSKEDPKPFVIFNDNEDLNQQFPVVRSIKDNNLTRETYNISKDVKNKVSNIPTLKEQELYNLSYNKFDRGVLKPFNYVYWIAIPIYILFYLSVLFFMYVNPLLKLKKATDPR